MELKRTYRLLLIVFLVSLVSACSKSEIRSNKLVKQGRWIFTRLEIGSNQVTFYPKWDFQAEPVDKEFVQATWTHADGSTCIFQWRFDYYEGTFTFMPDPTAANDPMDKAFIQCNNMAGAYTVITEKNKLFEFESVNTSGYSGVRVFIQIQPL